MFKKTVILTRPTPACRDTLFRGTAAARFATKGIAIVRLADAAEMRETMNKSSHVANGCEVHDALNKARHVCGRR